MARLDTSLESSGAEFLVLGYLLIESVQAFKAYTNIDRHKYLHAYLRCFMPSGANGFGVAAF